MKREPLLNERYDITIEVPGRAWPQPMVVEQVTPTHVHMTDGRSRVTVPRGEFAAVAKRRHEWSIGATSLRCVTCGLVVPVPECEGSR